MPVHAIRQYLLLPMAAMVGTVNASPSFNLIEPQTNILLQRGFGVLLLMEVKAATLMIVGSNDHTPSDHNRKAGGKMHEKPMLEVAIGASHLPDTSKMTQ